MTIPKTSPFSASAPWAMALLLRPFALVTGSTDLTLQLHRWSVSWQRVARQAQ